MLIYAHKNYIYITFICHVSESVTEPTFDSQQHSMKAEPLFNQKLTNPQNTIYVWFLMDITEEHCKVSAGSSSTASAIHTDIWGHITWIHHTHDELNFCHEHHIHPGEKIKAKVEGEPAHTFIWAPDRRISMRNPPVRISAKISPSPRLSSPPTHPSS